MNKAKKVVLQKHRKTKDAAKRKKKEMLKNKKSVPASPKKD